MKKSYPYNVLDEIRKCKECGKPLKKRIAKIKPTADLCYKHYSISESN